MKLSSINKFYLARQQNFNIAPYSKEENAIVERANKEVVTTFTWSSICKEIHLKLVTKNYKFNNT